MPKLSIITINLNNAVGLQVTMDSVLTQSFKDFEYIVIDGGSNDASRKLIESNSGKLTFWISEPDHGVYHAMNKGIKKAKGDYLLFLNSGDHLLNSKVLDDAIDQFGNTEIVYGNIYIVEKDNNRGYTGVYPDQLSFQHFVDGALPHPASFIKKTVFEKVGFYDESFSIVADWKFFLDAICWHNVSYKHLDMTIAVFQLDGLSSLPKNQVKIQEEKNRVFQQSYPLFIKDSKELIQLRAFRHHPIISRFAKVIGAIGLLK